MARQFTKEANDKITYPHLSALDGVRKFFLWFRYYPTSCDGSGGIIGQMSADDLYGWAFGHSNLAADGFAAYVRAGTGGTYIVWNNCFTLNTWHAVGVLYDGYKTQGIGDEPNTRIALYVNDVFTGASFVNGSPSALVGVTTVPLVVSLLQGASESSNLGITGRIADIGIWVDVTPTPTQRTALYNGVPLNEVLPNSQRFYAPLDSAYTSGVDDLIGPYAGTVSGTSVVAHPTGVPTTAPIIVTTAHPETVYSLNGNVGGGYDFSALAGGATVSYNVDFSDTLGGTVTIAGQPINDYDINTRGLEIVVLPQYGSTLLTTTTATRVDYLQHRIIWDIEAITLRLGTGKYSVRLRNIDAGHTVMVQVTDVKFKGIGMAHPDMTFNPIGGVRTAATLAPGAPATIALDYSQKMEGQVTVVNVPGAGGTLSTARGVRCEFFPQFGASLATSTLTDRGYDLPSQTALASESRTFFIPTGKWLLKLSQLDATYSTTVEVTDATVNGMVP